jgi:hypothetical protein
VFKYLGIIFSSLVFSMAASAAAVVYQFDGVGTGLLNGQSFSGSAFSFEFTGDTDNVLYEGLPGFPPSVGFYKVNVGNGLINIEGFSSTVFTEGVEVFVNTGNAVGFKGVGSSDYLSLNDDILFGYQLDESIGPAVGTCDHCNQFINISTGLGSLTFTDFQSVAFTATVVPVPAAAWLFGSALLGLAGLKRRK